MLLSDGNHWIPPLSSIHWQIPTILPSSVTGGPWAEDGGRGAEGEYSCSGLGRGLPGAAGGWKRPGVHELVGAVRDTATRSLCRGPWGVDRHEPAHTRFFFAIRSFLLSTHPPLSTALLYETTINTI